MSDQPQKSMIPPPGQPVIPFVNWGGMRALYVKEVRRFFKVHLQTIWGPAFTTLLYLVIFSVALGRGGREVMGHPFATFVAPGLIVMGMMNAAFANASFSLLAGKMQGTIIDYLMPPLSTAEMMAALVGASVTRALLVGVVLWLAMLFWPGVDVIPEHPFFAIWFGLMGSMLLSLIGLLTSIWADKFDHNAMIQNFVVGPLSLLSGTFYSIDNLHTAVRVFSHANPFFFVISGFRFGFLGTTDSPILVGAVGLFVLNALLVAINYAVLARGWKIKT